VGVTRGAASCAQVEALDGGGRNPGAGVCGAGGVEWGARGSAILSGPQLRAASGTLQGLAEERVAGARDRCGRLSGPAAAGCSLQATTHHHQPSPRHSLRTVTVTGTPLVPAGASLGVTKKLLSPTALYAGLNSSASFAALAAPLLPAGWPTTSTGHTGSPLASATTAASMAEVRTSTVFLGVVNLGSGERGKRVGEGEIELAACGPVAAWVAPPCPAPAQGLLTDGDGRGRDRRAAPAVGGGKVEGVGAVVARGGRVGEAAVALQDQRAVRGGCGHGRRERASSAGRRARTRQHAPGGPNNESAPLLGAVSARRRRTGGDLELNRTDVNCAVGHLGWGGG
jgi:hypothetical protein